MNEEQVNKVCSAIRGYGNGITCQDIAQILSTLAAAMNSAGFNKLDLEVIDEASGFICGETA